jgi:GT2 family glycosyltransferase
MNSRLRRWLPGGSNQGSFTSYGYPNRIIDTDRRMDVEFMYGCFMAARRRQAQQIGFDEGLPGYGLAEDEDFSYRLSRLGRIEYLPDVHVLHLNLGFGSMDRRTFSKRVVVNRRYLFKKNFAQTTRAGLGFSFLIVTLFFHRLLNLDLAGAKGIVDGVREIRR